MARSFFPVVRPAEDTRLASRGSSVGRTGVQRPVQPSVGERPQQHSANKTEIDKPRQPPLSPFEQTAGTKLLFDRRRQRVGAGRTPPNRDAPQRIFVRAARFFLILSSESRGSRDVTPRVRPHLLALSAGLGEDCVGHCCPKPRPRDRSLRAVSAPAVVHLRWQTVHLGVASLVRDFCRLKRAQPMSRARKKDWLTSPKLNGLSSAGSQRLS